LSLTLHFHPLASYCHKALIALYENETPFDGHLVDLGDSAARAAFARLWPMARMPVLRDDQRDQTIAEASIVIEYLALHYPGPIQLIPVDAEQARTVRFLDRFYDLYVNDPMAKVVTDRVRPADARDPYGVAQAKSTLETACDFIDRQMEGRAWAAGDRFSMADCAAAPALYYADRVLPLASRHPRVTAYLERLRARPSFTRVLREAEPYLAMFPS
jgi:glutathione S-transferase